MAALFFPQLLAICVLVAPIGYTMATTPATPGAPGAPGAPSDVPSDRCDVLQAARFAVAAYNAGVSQESYAYKLTAITSSEVQVVSGLNYILYAELGLTWCMKAQPRDAETCPLQVNGKRLLCRFVVYTIPWEGKALLTEERCIESPFRPRCYRRSLTQGTQ